MQQIDLLEHQVELIQDTETKFIGLVGGYRSGKTHALCIKAIQLASLNTRYPGALLEPTIGMIGRTLVPTMTPLLYELGIPFDHNKSAGYYDLTLAGKQKRIWLLSAENYERAAGMSLSWFGIDEIDLIPESIATAAWRMMTSRLTQGESKQGFCVSTPEGYGFLYRYFEEQAGEDRRLIRASTYDNPFLDDDYFNNMRQTHTEKQLEAYLYGRFVNFNTGSVYHQYDRALNHTNFTEDQFHESWPMYVAVDFNANIMATAIIFVDRNNNTVYIVDESWGEKDTTSLIYSLKRKYPKRQFHLMCDASGTRGTGVSDVAIFSNAGFDVSLVERSNPAIVDRVNAVNVKICNAQGQRSLFVNTNKCKHVTEAFEQQAWKDGKPDKSSNLDHMPDAIGYLIYKLFKIKSNNKGKIVVH